MGNSAIAVFKPLYERILSATLQLQRGQGSSAELSSAFQADQVQKKCLEMSARPEGPAHTWGTHVHARVALAFVSGC